MYYSPENIETYEAKGGYSATKLLAQSLNTDNSMVGGATSNAHESLFEKLQHLQVPLGLVSRRYPSTVRKHTDADDTETKLIDSKIFEELESMIFHNKQKGTRKNMQILKSSGTKKYRPTK